MQLNKKTVRSVFLIILFAALCYAVITNFGFVWHCIGSVFSVTFPIYLGFFLAFIINLPMRQFEKLFSRGKGKFIKAIKRPVSLLLSIASVVAVLVLIIELIIPELLSAVAVLIDYVPKALNALYKWFDGHDIPYDEIKKYITSLNINWADLGKQALGFATGAAQDILNVSVSFIVTLVGGIINVFISFIIAIYVVLSKEKLKSQLNKLIHAYLPQKAADYTVHVINVTKTTFAKYVVGQCTEALILGSLMTIGMMILQLPYAPMIGAMISVLALIPIVGIAIAVTLGTFMILMVNPIQAIVFLIFYMCLQQIEGNLIYPRVVGASIGLDPLWVLSAILVGGGLFGVVGLFFAVPTVSVVFKLVKEDTNRRLTNKNIQI